MKQLFFIILLILFSSMNFAQGIHFDWIDAEPDTIYADCNITYSEITVRVVDEDEIPVAEVPVHFECDIGNCIYNVNTNDEGLAETTFWDAGDIGTAHITATIDSDEIEVEVEILPLNLIDDKLTIFSDFYISPNPFSFRKNNTIHIQFSLARKQIVNIKIFNIKGQFIDTILNKQLDTGNHKISYDFSSRNKKISRGIYFVFANFGTEVSTKKVAIY